MPNDSFDRSGYKTLSGSNFSFLPFFWYANSLPTPFPPTYTTDGGLEQKRACHGIRTLGCLADISVLVFFSCFFFGGGGDGDFGNNCYNDIIYSLSLVQGGGGGKEEKEGKRRKKLHKNKRHTGKNL